MVFKNRLLFITTLSLAVYGLWVITSQVVKGSAPKISTAVTNTAPMLAVAEPDTFKVLKHRGESNIQCAHGSCSGTAVQSYRYNLSDGGIQQAVDANSYDVYTATGINRAFETRDRDIRDIVGILNGNQDKEGTVANRLSSLEGRINARINEKIIEAVKSIPESLKHAEAAKAIKEAVLADIRKDLDVIRADIEKLKKPN